MKKIKPISQIHRLKVMLPYCFLVLPTLSFADIYQAEDYTWSFDTTTGNSGGAYKTGDVDIQATQDEGGGYNVGWIEKNEWLAYQNIKIAQSGNYIVNARVASPSGATFSIDLNSGETQLGSFEIPATGSWDKWITVTKTIYIEAGIHNLGVFAVTNGWNFNWIEIIPEADILNGEVVWAVNAGGNQYTAVDGTVYLADEGFTAGTSAKTTQIIHATQDSILYQSERWGNDFSYEKILENGTYQINLRLAETYWQSPNDRKFSFSAEGRERLSSIDIVAEKGGRDHAAYDLSIPDVVVSDGKLNLNFKGIVDAAKISAFAVRKSHMPENEWQLIWQDEFNTNGAIDTTKWTHELWVPGRVNNEWQRYTDRPENSRVENGKLVIEARKDNYMGDEYSSARIHSANKADFLYGRIEVSAKLPNGIGTWPAIWMMPTDVFSYATTCDAQTGWDEDCDAWPNSGEIDIMEHVGYDTGKVHATVHNLDGYWVNGEQIQGTVYQPAVDDGFHTYALEWSPDRIDMFIDNTLYYTYVNPKTGWQAWPYDKPFHVILNLVVGGDWGAVAGVDPDIWPQRMEVDYVRMYQK
ncbi:malectin domain-containing carbohydrate-binding protein [Pseudoalteromonas sp. NBT06-2]|uniref:malectin domain-containing carbohydrate-binding protein n=1 Tax=Pseudoalteromonas sp. NBT06-2 TaxID=2025950 RepID=UPI0014831DE3|nr:malectin domain-containing carbohydrate-binding protein [Pseudoalteromonas sp. NBT06-2]